MVDYLVTLPEVDSKHIAITGYSRDGKAMVIGARIDERIAAVIAGSPGVGGILPFRLASEFNQAESIQSTTMMFPDWLHPPSGISPAAKIACRSTAICCWRRLLRGHFFWSAA